jgi:hypothetical protein
MSETFLAAVRLVPSLYGFISTAVFKMAQLQNILCLTHNLYMIVACGWGHSRTVLQLLSDARAPVYHQEQQHPEFPRHTHRDTLRWPRQHSLPRLWILSELLSMFLVLTKTSARLGNLACSWMKRGFWIVVLTGPETGEGDCRGNAPTTHNTTKKQRATWRQTPPNDRASLSELQVET